MKPLPLLHSFLLAALLAAALPALAQRAPGESFFAATAATGSGGAAASEAPDSRAYADGTRAINDGRWSDAIALFSNVARQQSDHADGALYWKAYAENKQGQANAALQTCNQLRQGFPKSRWIDECGALEIEIRAKSGSPLDFDALKTDDMKLLVLAALMRQDEPRALAEIQQILNSDSSQKLKDGVLFILGQHHGDETYPQIVRLSLLEGDVRIARGKQAEHNGSAWEIAVAGLPLETGFSLVTGAGRAEIEFENASTLYVAENSVLTFNDLHTTAGIPYSEVALLSGTVTLDIRPYIAGEVFMLKTPTDSLVTRYPEKAHSRVTSYIDAVAIAPLEAGALRLGVGSREPLAPGQTRFYREGRPIDSASLGDPQAFAAWDKWVAGRIAQRSAALAEVMKDSGLTAPLPGMAELSGQGTFFDCAPYGTCWEPSEATAAHAQGASFAGPETASALAARATGQSLHTSSPAAVEVFERQTDFPCMPEGYRTRVARNLNTGDERTLDTGYGASRSYSWALCHAGAWINHRNHYVWVVGKRHHRQPVHWIRSGHTVAFVPIHPHDVKGMPPVNRKFDVFPVNGKGEEPVRPIRFDPDRPIEVLKSPPKEFARASLPQLARAEAPHIEGHQVSEPLAARSGARPVGIPIHFDSKAQSFMMPRNSMPGSRSAAGFAPVTNRGGNLQSHSGPSSSTGGGAHTSSASSSGGGSRSGGASSSSTAASSSSPSSTTAPAPTPSSGSNHH